MGRTDIWELRDIAIQFLHQEPELRMGIVGSVVIHPFLQNSVAALEEPNGKTEIFDIFEDSEKYEKWLKQTEDYINKIDSWDSILLMIRKPYRLAYFKYVNTFLSSKDFAEMLITCWLEADFVSNDVNVSKEEVISWFMKADKKYLMNNDEQQILKEMPDHVKIYRGVGEAKYKNGFSWTLNLEIAKFFAKRFAGAGKKTYIYECIIDKGEILCYTDARGEAEVIVNPKNLKKYDVKEADV